MINIDVSKTKPSEIQKILLSAVSPRPIAMASTIDKDGNVNLAPFSFYNAFGSNPAVLIFSPALRGRDGKSKNTLDNLKEVPEVVINAVSFDMVEQTNIAGMEYPKGVNEFIKSGFETIASESVRPPRIANSPVQFECKVHQIIETGQEGGAGQLVICHIQRIHISESVLDAHGNIDNNKIDLVARMGGDSYSRAKDGIFEVKKPGTVVGIGIDALPDFIKNSESLNGNELGKLGSLDKLPDSSDLEIYKSDSFVLHSKEEKMEIAKKLLSMNQNWEALCYLLS